MRDVVARAVAQPDAVMAALGVLRRAGINVLYRASNLTVLNLLWGPGMTIMPHDHRMWAVIGIYTGREDIVSWRRLPPDAGREIEAAGSRPLCRGDFLTQERSEWDPETLHERQYDVAKARRLFEDSNRALAHA